MGTLILHDDELTLTDEGDVDELELDDDDEVVEDFDDEEVEGVLFSVEPAVIVVVVVSRLLTFSLMVPSVFTRLLVLVRLFLVARRCPIMGVALLKFKASLFFKIKKNSFFFKLT